jgi:hypothetical protein
MHSCILHCCILALLHLCILIRVSLGGQRLPRAPDSRQTRDSGKDAKRQHDAARFRLGRKLVAAGPDPSHRRYGDENKDEQ